MKLFFNYNYQSFILKQCNLRYCSTLVNYTAPPSPPNQGIEVSNDRRSVLSKKIESSSVSLLKRRIASRALAYNHLKQQHEQQEYHLLGTGRWVHNLIVKSSSLTLLSCSTSMTSDYSKIHDRKQFFFFSTSTHPPEEVHNNNETITSVSQEQTKQENGNKTKNKKPSVLTSLPVNFSAGQALSLLQIYYKNGKLIRFQDLTDLCKACRSGMYKDARVVRTVLMDIKRCNQFIIQKDHADLAMRSMLKSLLKQNNEVSDQIRVGLWIGKEFCNESTGLYVSAPTAVVEDVVLDTLWNSGLNSLDPISKNETKEMTDNSSIDDNEDHNVDFLKVTTITKNVIDVLLTRASNPTKDMKKRAKRKYLKYLKCCEGPTPKSIDLAVKICTSFDTKDGIQKARDIVDIYGNKAFLGRAHDETIRILENAEERLQKKEEEQTKELSQKEEDTIVKEG